MKTFGKSTGIGGATLHNQAKRLPLFGLRPFRILKAKVFLKGAPAEGFSGSIPGDSPFCLIGHANLCVVFKLMSLVGF